jgi:DNA-binding transcriptional LysR family regulator
MLDVKRLQVLRTVAHTGSFSAAADVLSFTQPAISRQIATLEAEAGARLVERSSRGIRLTPAGELLVEHADAILDRLAVAEAQLEAVATLAAGRLRIGAFPTANSSLVPLAIKAFSAAHPDVELRLEEDVSHVLLDRLRAGELDLAVVSDHQPDAGDPSDDIVLEPLMDDPLYVALPEGHPLSERHGLTMADLREETWIEGRNSICATPLRLAANAAGYEPRVGFESAQWLGKQGLVAAGVGVTLIPSLALATLREDIVLRRVEDPQLQRQVFTATLCCGYVCPALEPMRAILRTVAGEHCFDCDTRVTEPPAAAVA